MKSPLLCRRYLIAAVIAALSLAAGTTHSAEPTKKSAPSNTGSEAEQFKFTVTKVIDPHVAKVREKLERVRQRVSVGAASEEEANEHQFILQQLERNVRYLIDIDSAGGPLSAFIAAASRSPAISFDVINVASPADLETPLPPFQLRNAHWGTIIEVLSSLLESHGLNLRFAGGDYPNPAEAKSFVCVLRRTGPAQAVHGASAEPEFESYPIGEYLVGNQNTEVILDALRTAWALDPRIDLRKVAVKFHPGTKLLLIRGPAPTTAIARQVIAGLQKKPVQ